MRSAASLGQVMVALAMALGLLVTYVLSGMVSHNKEILAVATGMGVGAVVASLISLEFAVAALLVVSFTDGFIKCMDPSKFSVFIKDLFLLLALARWGWLNLMRRDWPSLRLPLTVPYVMFLVYCLMQMFNTATASWLVAVAGVRTWVAWIPLAFITYDLAINPRAIRRLLLYVILLALATGVYGIVQYNIGFGHLERIGSGFNFYRERFSSRTVSTFVSPGAFGAAMSLCAIVAVASAAFFRERWVRTTAVITTAVAIVGLATSQSRAPLLGLAVGTLTAFLMVRKPQFILAALLAALPALWVMNSFAQGAFEKRFNAQLINRAVVWERISIPIGEALGHVVEDPLGRGVASGTGVGRGAAVVKEEELRVSSEQGGMIENEYGRSLKELGIPGFALFVYMLYIVVKGNAWAYRRCRTPRYRMLAGACLGVTTAVIAQLAVGSALYIVPGGILFWMFYALGMRLPAVEALALGTQEAPVPQPAAVPRLSPAPYGRRL